MNGGPAQVGLGKDIMHRFGNNGLRTTIAPCPIEIPPHSLSKTGSKLLSQPYSNHHL